MTDHILIPRSNNTNSSNLLPEGIHNVRVISASIMDSKFDADEDRAPGVKDKQLRLDLVIGGRNYSKWFTIPLDWWHPSLKEERRAAQISGEHISKMWEVAGLPMELNAQAIVGQEFLWTIQIQTVGDGKSYDRIRKIEPKAERIENEDWPTQAPAPSQGSNLTPF